MATTTDTIKTTYPLPVYNYKVDVNQDTVAFSEVSGLDIVYDTTTYKQSPGDGQTGVQVMHMPAQGTPANVTLRKGVVRKSSVPTFYGWISSTRANVIEKKDVFIRLCDEDGNTVITWKVGNAFPTRLEAPSFQADSNDVAVEAMELMADGVWMTEP